MKLLKPFGVRAIGGNLTVATLGKGLEIAEHSLLGHGRMGVSALNGQNLVTVANTTITSKTRIFLTIQTAGVGAIGVPIAVNRTAGEFFTIRSTVDGDNSLVAWLLVEPTEMSKIGRM